MKKIYLFLLLPLSFGKIIQPMQSKQPTLESMENFQAYQTFYEVLGISKSATESEINTAYREKSIKWHPDKWQQCNGVPLNPEIRDRANNNYYKLKEAYDNLINLELRDQYDQKNFLSVIDSLRYTSSLSRTLEMLQKNPLVSYINLKNLGFFLGSKFLETIDDDSSGATILYDATSEKNEFKVKFLLLAGANTEKPGPYKTTPLHIAVSCNNPNLTIIQLLLDARANPNSIDGGNRTPLWFAVNKGHIKVTEMLLQARAHPDIASCETITPLHMAASFKNHKMYQLLVEAGADPKKPNKVGHTAESISRDTNSRAIVPFSGK